jgi:hypothetical protein
MKIPNGRVADVLIGSGSLKRPEAAGDGRDTV